METNTDKRKTLIRRLLVEQLLPEEKQNLLKRNSVENEMKKQWKQFEDDPIKSEVKKRIWRNVQRRCEGKSDTLVHIELWQALQYILRHILTHPYNNPPKRTQILKNLFFSENR